MALLEAMARGVPPVASAVGGIPQVIQSGENGFLVQPEKPGEIADAVERLYRDRSLWNRFSEAAQRTISERYNVFSWTRSVEAVYQQMLGTISDHAKTPHICREIHHT
jgi:glycosyltransferase involved in cell wall biosynthesis